MLKKVEILSKTALGNTTVIASFLDKYASLRQIQMVLDGCGYRVSICQKCLGSGSQVMKSSESQAYFNGVIACDSVWLCPVCGEKIRARKADEIRQALAGRRSVLVTLTLQHDKRDSLEGLLRSLKASYRSLKAGRWWQAFQARYGVMASVTAYEITYGVTYGWHPHIHTLAFLEDEINLEGFWQELQARYIRTLKRLGGYASEYHGVDVRDGEKASGYLTKGLAYELTGNKSGRSGNYSFLDLVSLSRSHAWAVSLIREYASATYRKNALTWSRNARQILGIQASQVSQELKDSVEVAFIPRDTWQVVKSHALQGFLLELAVVDEEKLRAYISQLNHEVKQTYDTFKQ